MRWSGHQLEILFLLVNAIQNIGNKLWTTINCRRKNGDDFIEIYAHSNMVIFGRDKSILSTIISVTYRRLTIQFIISSFYRCMARSN
jgi:hypothetical protein